MTTQKTDTPPVQEPSPEAVKSVLQQAQNNPEFKNIFEQIKSKLYSLPFFKGLIFEFAAGGLQTANYFYSTITNGYNAKLNNLEDFDIILSVLSICLVIGGFSYFYKAFKILLRSMEKEQNKPTQVGIDFYNEIKKQKNNIKALTEIDLKE